MQDELTTNLVAPPGSSVPSVREHRLNGVLISKEEYDRIQAHGFGVDEEPESELEEEEEETEEEEADDENEDE